MSQLSKTEFNFMTGRQDLNTTKDLVDFKGYLVHQGIVSSLNQLQQQAKKDIGADLQIISSYRSFERQNIIWNNKVLDKRAVYDDHGNKLDPRDFSRRQFVEKIMRFSAIPGSSRHHWGTDIDIFDANKLHRQEVELVPSECRPDGACGELHLWLDEKINSSESFDFFRPYDQDLGGVSIEKWHLSFAPIAQEFYGQYTLDVFIKNIEQSHIEGKASILSDAEFFFKNFIANITLA